MRTLTVAAVTLTIACVFVHTPIRAQEEDHSGLVLVQRTIDTRYTDDDANFQKVLDTTLTRTYKIKRGDSLQGIVSEHFSVGPTATKNIYEGIASKIQALNNIAPDDLLAAGKEIRLPDIPPMQWKRPVPGNPNYGVPRIQFPQSQTEKAAGVAAAKLTDLGRKATGLVTKWVWLTPEQAKAEAKLSGENTSIADYYWTQPITLKFAEGPAAEKPGSVQDDAKFLASLVKRKNPKQDIIVFILDDSWPSQAAFESSRAFLVAALDQISTANHLPAPAWPAEIRSGSAKTDFPLQTPGRHSHAALIESALAPFTSLTSKVHVVYLPLFTEQKWSTEIWQELADIAMLAKNMHGSLGQMKPPDDLVQESRKTAVDLIKVVPNKAVDDVGSAQQAPLTVLNRIAQLYANSTGTPYFISMSWTVEKYILEFGPDADTLGLLLAAAGNDGKDVIANAIYMAYRAKAFPGDVLAVMNTDGFGDVHCGSSSLPVSGAGPFYGLAYDGAIGGITPACATSFSTPRVAWLLALRQAYNAPIVSADRANWFALYRSTLLNLQSAPQASSRRYLLSVAKLFDGL